uniref:pericentrin isoform X2 n=1 Tax=Jaculus jaculus TaxID=51337 RepID=UPI001E1AFF95|nr:pericentrin isoform X2 [Jaculus jaculus]
MEDEQEQRRRKVEAGKAKLANFRQRKTKGDCPHSKKKTAKRKGSTVDAPVQEENPVVDHNSAVSRGEIACESTSCSNTSERDRGAFATQEQDCDLDGIGQQQRPPPPPPPQTAHSLELEAMRLSLNNMHTAQLELTQANLQKEKETALTELREMLNGRRAQELALLQSRQQCELELMRAQHAREKEEMVLRCEQETAELKEKLRSEMEKNAQIIENLKQDWKSEKELCLENLRKELSAKHQSEMESLQNQFQKELAEQRAELEKMFKAKTQAEVSLKSLETQHQEAIKKLQEDLQSEHCQYLEDLELKFREKEKEKQFELENLQASYEDLKAQSQEEIRCLWSQLESLRTKRKELNDPWDPLLSGESPLEELEHLRLDFAQQQQRDRAQHESELEQLRVYFEKKLKDAEKTYQEDLTLFQQRLQEAREDSPLESAEVSLSCMFPEVTSGREGEEQLGPHDLQPEQPELYVSTGKLNPDCQACKQEPLATEPSSQLSSRLSPASPHPTQIKEDGSDSCFLEPGVLEVARLPSTRSDQHSQELTQAHLQCLQDMALEVDAQVASRVLGLEAEHKVKLLLLQTELKEEIELLKIENRKLHEKLQHETHLREDLESVRNSLVEDHQEKLNKAEEKIQLMKEELKKREAAWELLHEDLKRDAEENLASMRLELREKAESEKQSLMNRFELRETSMRLLQEQQAAQILDLERSLMEQHGRLRQLEQELPGDEVLPCRDRGCGSPVAQGGEHTMLLCDKKDCALRLMLARNRFLEERKEIMENFAKEQDAFLRDAQEKHTQELQLLQQEHQQQLLSLEMELTRRHQSELAERVASLEGERRAILETHMAELQVKHAAEISALEARHLSNLDALESCYLADIQIIRDEHRRALELLQAELEEQLQKRDSSHQEVLTLELEKLKLKHNKELQSVKESLRIEMNTKHTEKRQALATGPQGVHQEEECTAIHSERRLLEEKEAALDSVSAEVLPPERHPQVPLQGLREAPPAEVQKARVELAEPQELQASQAQAVQLRGQVLSLSQEIEECRAELERLQQRRERENQEGATLIRMLRADLDLSQSEGKALRNALRRLLGLFGETLKTAVTLKNQIGERMGLSLDHVDATDAGQTPLAAPALDEMWSDEALLELDRTLPEGAEMSSVAEISSHVCESFFMSPENTLECEQPIRRVYQSLSMAVEGLLDMALDSSKQLEEARQLHCQVEKEFHQKDEEMTQAVQKQQELLDLLREESASKAELALELHTAEGLLEGFKVEKADLQEALGRKEESEQQLVLELESLQRQLQQAAQELATLREESSILWSQKETSANEAAAREAALQKEVESLTREHLEARKQSEKDHTALLSQMRVLESELEDQLSQHQGCAQLAEEVTTLKQQLAALDKHLRSQRQFMDAQASEREHEREEFQQEIQRLEEQLRQAARPRPAGAHDSQVELLQEKLREKSDGFNELLIKKDLADQQLLIKEEEIKCLKEANANTQRKVAQLQEELEKQKKTTSESKDKEALNEQQMSGLLLVPVSQSRLSEDGCPMFLPGTISDGPEVQLEVVQRTLLQRESEVLDLKEQLEKIKDDLDCKNEEILHLNLKLDMQNNPAAISLQEAHEETAGLEVVYSRSSEIEELKSIIENLQENQERLQKDKAEEVEQLHEVIEKLQRELTLMGPIVHELSDHQAESLHSELFCYQAEGLAGQTLRTELEAALTAKEALGQLLADQAQGHSQALKALQQRLQTAEEAAARHLAELESCVAVREAEMKNMVSQIQEFEALLKAKEAAIVQKDLEIDTMNKRKVAHSLELEVILLALAQFRYALEQQPLATPDEPPELQQLRLQCARLSRHLQVLHQRFLRCQVELGQHQARGMPGCSPHPGTDAQADGDDLPEQGTVGRCPALTSHTQDPQGDLQPAKVLVTLKDSSLHKAESVMSVLTMCQRRLQAEMLLLKNELSSSMVGPSRGPEGMQAEEKGAQGCQLPTVDLLAQVKVLQEKLRLVVHAMASQDGSPEDPAFQQPSASLCVSASDSSKSSHSAEETDPSPPVHAFNSLIDVTKNQDSLIQSEMPGFPTQEKLVSQGGPLSSHTSVHTDSLYTEEAEPRKDPVRGLDLSSWSSPEVLRKDLTPEPQPSLLPLTPSTGTLSLHSASTSPKDWRDSLLGADLPELPCYPDESAAGQSPPRVVASSALQHQVEETAVEKDVEDDIITSFDSQEQTRCLPLQLEGRNDRRGKSDSAMLTLGSGEPKAPTTGVTAAPIPRGAFQPPGAMKEKEVHGKHMKALLQMVFDESHQILALSESQDLPSALSKGEPREPLDGFPRERQVLLEAAPGEKVPLDTQLAWSRELLTAVQEVFSRDQESTGLQPRSCGSDLGNDSSLFKRLEKIIRDQGDLQEKVQEDLGLPDRSSLLSEIQALRAQLRMTHLQSQEKLHQLCTALTSAESRGSQREHQLRRQVELLAYKVEQEKCIASNLQKTLSKEQEKASEVQKHLVVEQSTVHDLKSELHESKQENAKLLESLKEAQQEVLQLRAMLDGKESELKVALKELECERGKERALQAQQEEEQLRHLQKEGQSSRALEELKISLEKQRAQNNQLCVALKHERAAKDNLQKELQIESSRCEALLAQEQNQLSDLKKSLEAEKSHSLELSEALRHERLLTEQLSRSAQEACARQETQVQHALLRKLKAEKARALELQAMVEKVQQQAAHAQQQLEAQAQKRFAELRREKERELELQRQRDGHKMEQLQRMVSELQWKEEVPWRDSSGQGPPHPESLELDRIRKQQQELEKIRQQLLCVAGLLTTFTSRTVDRTINDWTSSNEKAVSSLMRTLEDLKSELSKPTSSQKKIAAELQVHLVDELMKDNDSLTRAVSTAAREKADLSRTVSRLEKSLKRHAQRGCALSRPGKSAWKQDGTVLQSLPAHSDPEWPTATANEEANTCNVKMEKLYLHCLRAESFRKALIYQKKYLLLLIGGFQDSEQETLSMIAHLGVFPSKADKKTTMSRPFTKFRTAVRVVIAVLRLRFLVKKWQEVDRRGALVQGRAARPGHRVSRRHPSPPETRESLPTRDLSSGHSRNPGPRPRPAAAASLSRRERSPSLPNSRLERSLNTSEDPEHSLTEYIHHLEMIQQRLGGPPPDSPQKSCHQKIKP